MSKSSSSVTRPRLTVRKSGSSIIAPSRNLSVARSDYWQTRILRPRFTQLYPPEKHEAKTILELRFPSDLQEIPLTGLIQQNDPRIAQLRSSDARFSKVAEQIEHGQANKSITQDAADFLRAALPILAGNAHFVEGELSENGGFEWLVPPEDATDKQQRAEDKDRPPTPLRSAANQLPESSLHGDWIALFNRASAQYAAQHPSLA